MFLMNEYIIYLIYVECRGTANSEKREKQGQKESGIRNKVEVERDDNNATLLFIRAQYYYYHL